jgi:hypothetical protein
LWHRELAVSHMRLKSLIILFVGDWFYWKNESLQI